MEAFLLLARATNTSLTGEVNILGAHWSIVGPSPLPPFCLIVCLRIDEKAQRAFPIRLRLLDSEGIVVTTGPDASPVQLTQEIELPPSPKPPGVPDTLNLNLEIPGGMLLDPGRYEFSLDVDGEHREDWRVAFYVRREASEFPPVAVTDLGAR